MSSDRDYRADNNTWVHWSRCKYWSVNEAGCLITEVDPDRVASSFSGYLYPKITLAVQRVLCDELECSGEDRLRPARVFEVAELLGLFVPAALRDRVAEIDARREAKGAEPKSTRIDETSSRPTEASAENPSQDHCCDRLRCIRMETRIQGGYGDDDSFSDNSHRFVGV